MTQATTSIPRRDPARVMRLDRLGSLHQCRLSFMRILTRRMARDGWTFTRPHFEIDQNGVGHAVYSARGPDRTYSLVAFAHDLPPEKRSDRVIADAWDATFALYDGVPHADDIARLASNVPVQEAGRIAQTELTLSRANRSVRLWTHVVDALATGQQPDVDQINDVGYLMRTTAVYGSGKFGAADYGTIAPRPEMCAPFQAEMLTVYLIRTFVRDLVNHMAARKGGSRAASLDPAIAQQLGIGNSTGLGMAPFIINHPVLFNNWIMAREEAISRVLSLSSASQDAGMIFRQTLAQSEITTEFWRSDHPVQQDKLRVLRADIAALQAHLATADLETDSPWNRLYLWAEDHLGVEGQEFVASLMLEPYPELVDGLADCMSDMNSDAFVIDGAMPVADVSRLLLTAFGWATEVDWSQKDACARAWYVSAEKLEPRLGERFDEPIAEYEQPLAPARDAAAALADLGRCDPQLPVAEFLSQHPNHRHTIRRAQISRIAPYGEIRDNTISATVMPIDLLRAKLSFFGATQFDPRSDRWVRICMFAGAPYPADLSPDTADRWIYPDVTT